MCVYIEGLSWGLQGKESTTKAGDMGSIPGSGISPGEGSGKSQRVKHNLATTQQQQIYIGTVKKFIHVFL